MPWRLLVLLLLGAVLLLFVLGELMHAGARVSDDRVQRFDAAVLAGAHGGDSAPTAIRLPGNCYLRGECTRQYRISFRHDPAATGQYSLYIPQYTGRLEVALNGVPVVDSSFGETSVRVGQGVPQFAVLPDRVLQPGLNEFVLTLGERLGAGAIGPVYFGPDAVLRGKYGTAQFMVVMLPRLMDGALFAIGAIMLLIWMSRRHDQLYLLCAAISLSFALSSLSPVIAAAFGANLLMPANVLRFVGACLVLPFTWRLVGRVPPVRTRWFLLLPLAMFFVFMLLRASWATLLVPMLFVPIVLLLGAVALYELWRAGTRGGDGVALTLLAAIAVALSLTTRDQLVTAGVIDKGYVLLARFNGPILVIIMGTILLRRFADGLSLLENFNARLHKDVAAARARLQEVFEREKLHARRATLAAERVRLMGDLHDGIAGQLVSIIALSEQATEPASREVTHACHRALTDLRLVVDSMDDVGDDLGMMLAGFRDRIEPQLRRSGMRMDWRVRDLPDLPGLSPASTLGIFRILQEAVNNAARHSGAQAVEIASSASPLPEHGVRLTVRDHGCGGAAARRGHHGMDNMRRRATALGATLAVESDAGGTCVVLDLPESVRA